MYVLGIDAGGTKTLCLLADEAGTILSEGRGPGANLHAAGELAVEKVLHEVMESASNNGQELQNEKWQPDQRKNTQRRTETP